MPAVLLEIVVLALVFAVGYYAGRGSAARDRLDAEAVEQVRREILALRGLVARLKDLAWDNRELDPALSTIVIDEIRTYEKKELGG
jgi:lipopolysaccharide biosynthesis regulator YciM